MILAGRDLALWSLAVLMAAHALLAWQAAAPPVVGLLGLLFALALSAATWLGSWAYVGLDAVGRGRARILLKLVHGALVVTTPLAVGAAPALVPRAALLFAWLQVPTLMLAASETGVLAALMNAALLATLTALHGGLPAASAVTCFLFVLPLFLAFDHWARTLAAHPRVRVPAFGVVLRQALGLALPVAFGTAAFFLVLPPRPAESLLVAATRGVRPEPIGAAHRFLILSLLLGGIGILAAVRILRREGKAEAPSVEMLELLPLGDEPLPPEPERPLVPHAGSRGRILRAYLRFLADAARTVARRHPPETPREFAQRLREPGRPIRSVTELFMAARYGPAEPSEADARAAEDAGDEIRAAWRRRRRS
ncbi:MAG TPA: DUF4129 domain-containing protein [Vicinamibacteria bacterium]|nr:DUF4129 domain-containing protein [Vicinamibacteria bacterium]